MKIFSSLSVPAAGWLAMSLCGAFLWTGCGPAKRERPESPTEKPSVAAKSKPAVAEGDGDLLASLMPKSAADQEWEDAMKLLQPPTPPAEWETNPPTKEALAEFQKTNAAAALRFAERMKEFRAKYPQHARAEEAREAEQSLLGAAAQLGNTNAAAHLLALEAARLSDPALPEDERVQLRVEQLQRQTLARRETNVAAALDDFERGARALQKEFPKRAELAGLLLSVAQERADHGDIAQSRALAREILDRQPGEELKKAADDLVRMIDRVGQPFVLKFKAVDGREVDVQQMKGKVVLIDFWATWCGPCMKELPEVKTLHTRLQAKGFEIVGLNFDYKKPALLEVIAREKIPWPQYFEDIEKDNRFGVEFDINGLPTLWLVDKKGVLRDLNARENLAQKVEKLLAE